VVWCTGFAPDTGWLHVPVLTPAGAPAHTRGVTAFPGLYVAGYPWLSNRGSGGLLYGAAADAARVAQHIAASGGGRMLAGATRRSDIANCGPMEGAER
jgi:putative flavoprotein involved in K+ transport